MVLKLQKNLIFIFFLTFIAQYIPLLMVILKNPKKFFKKLITYFRIIEALANHKGRPVLRNEMKEDLPPRL